MEKGWLARVDLDALHNVWPGGIISYILMDVVEVLHTNLFSDKRPRYPYEVPKQSLRVIFRNM